MENGNETTHILFWCERHFQKGITHLNPKHTVLAKKIEGYQAALKIMTKIGVKWLNLHMGLVAFKNSPTCICYIPFFHIFD